MIPDFRELELRLPAEIFEPESLRLREGEPRSVLGVGHRGPSSAAFAETSRTLGVERQRLVVLPAEPLSSVPCSQHARARVAEGRPGPSSATFAGTSGVTGADRRRLVELA